MNIIQVASGSVIFEDIALERRRGKVEKTLPHGRRQSDPLSGRIVYETVNGYVLLAKFYVLLVKCYVLLAKC